MKNYWNRMKMKIIKLGILVQFILTLVSSLYGKEQEFLLSEGNMQLSSASFVNEISCIVPIQGKVIPNSIATVSFRVDEKEVKRLDPHIIKIKGLSCELVESWTVEVEGKLIKLESDEMRENWVTLGVLDTIAGSNTLSIAKTKLCTVSLVDGHVFLTCLGDWIEDNDYQVMLYLYTGKLTANGTPVEYNLSAQLKGKSLLFKMSNLKLIVDYEVVTNVFGVPFISVEEKEIILPDQILESILTGVPSVI